MNRKCLFKVFCSYIILRHNHFKTEDFFKIAVFMLCKKYIPYANLHTYKISKLTMILFYRTNSKPSSNMFENPRAEERCKGLYKILRSVSIREEVKRLFKDDNLISNGDDTTDSPDENANDIDDAKEYFPDADFQNSNMGDEESDTVNVPEVDLADSNGCSCDSSGCKCCQKLSISKVKLEGEVKNPPPVCLKIPGLKKKAKVCIEFYNLAVSGKQLKGCSKLSVKVFNVKVATVELGCFTLPFSDTSGLKKVSRLKLDNSRILFRAISLLVERKNK
ncbi:hypothetical protein KUTeg_002419 [Tegillarca granosa]|uniref:DUF4773 domain-containing protein n=1 Tax=Tegillarca granosa TaxID=220873 RepID=A0ABQ9FXU6_TEGGR|nr:hypothetical protein KUTeg_002419 [Tegillarca granosa]